MSSKQNLAEAAGKAAVGIWSSCLNVKDGSSITRECVVSDWHTKCKARLLRPLVVTEGVDCMSPAEQLVSVSQEDPFSLAILQDEKFL